MRFLKLAVLLLLLAGAVLLFRWIGPAELQSRLRSWMAPLGSAAPIAFVLAFGMLASLLVPCTPLNILGGALFGKLWGFLLNWSGSLLAASIAFFLARRLGRDAVAWIVPDRLLDRMDSTAERHGFSISLYLRAMQLPFGPINVAAGISRMRFRDFLLGTAVGILPGVFAFTFLADVIFQLRGPRDLLDRRFLLPAAILVVVLLIPPILRCVSETALEPPADR